MARGHWLLKSEPSVFSFDDLRALPGGATRWDGVRNAQARNHLRAMREGDLAFFYHSSTVPPAVVGVVQVTRAAYPDPTQFDRAHERFDPRSKPEAPAWVAIDVRAQEALPRAVALDELRREPATASMLACQKGVRLSVQPVLAAQWRAVLALARRKPKP